jgi:predicted ArsR family transcriptional regulator
VEVRKTPARELTLDLDRENLAAIGRTTVRDYSARLGISEHAAKVRLRALYDAGYATRRALTTCRAGRQPWVYTAAVIS